MATRPPATSGVGDPVGDAPVGWLVAIGAGLGLIAAVLLMADAPLFMAAGAVIGLVACLAVDTWRIES